MALNKKTECLLADDESTSAETIAKWIKAMGHTCEIVGSSEEARKRIHVHTYSYVVLDVKLKVDKNDTDPDSSTGMALLKWIHENRPDLPILMVTAYVDDSEFAAELMTCGASAFILKTSGASKFQQKVEEILKKSKGQMSPRSSTCEPKAKFDLIVDANQPNLMVVCGKEIDLTPLEFKFMSFLAQHPGDRLTNERIMTNVWGDHFVENQRIPSIKDDIHKKIKTQMRNYNASKFIINIRAAGWKLNLAPSKVKFVPLKTGT